MNIIDVIKKYYSLNNFDFSIDYIIKNYISLYFIIIIANKYFNYLLSIHLLNFN
jgi:hypothetical protein